MAIHPKKPFAPFISVEQIAAFDAARIETYTESRFLNAVLLALEEVGVGTSEKIARYLDLSLATVSHGVQICTGFTLTRLRTIRAIKMVAETKKAHPDWDNDHVARHVGYGNRSSIWNIIHNAENRSLVQTVAPQLLEEHRNFQHRTYDVTDPEVRKALDDFYRRTGCEDFVGGVPR